MLNLKCSSRITSSGALVLDGCRAAALGGKIFLKLHSFSSPPFAVTFALGYHTSLPTTCPRFSIIGSAGSWSRHLSNGTSRASSCAQITGIWELGHGGRCSTLVGRH